MGFRREIRRGNGYFTLRIKRYNLPNRVIARPSTRLLSYYDSNKILILPPARRLRAARSTHGRQRPFGIGAPPETTVEKQHLRSLPSTGGPSAEPGLPASGAR